MLFDSRLGAQHMTESDQTHAAGGPGPTSGPPRHVVLCLDGPPPVELHLIAADTVVAGRLSTNPVCLRCEPTDDPGNRDRTLLISAAHFELNNREGRVELKDLQSRNGTTVGGTRLAAGAVALILAKTLVNVGGALDLEVEPVGRGQVEEALEEAHAAGEARPPDHVAFLRVRRINNLPERQYVIIYHSGAIGPHPGALLHLPASLARPRGSRGFDFGAAPTEEAAAVVSVADGGLWIRLGSGEAAVNGNQLSGASVSFPTHGELRIGPNVIAIRSPASDGV